MVKFGNRLVDSLMDAAWAKYYVPYSDIKAMLLEDDEDALLSGADFFDALCLEKVDEFYFSKVRWLRDATDNAIPALRNLLKDSDTISTEPAVCEGTNTATLLSSFAKIISVAKRLRTFVVVNEEALRKIVKKYIRRRGSGKTSLPKVALACSDAKEKEAFGRTLRSIYELKDTIQVSCSSYYEYLQDSRILLFKQRERLRHRTKSSKILEKSVLARMIGVDAYRKLNVESTLQPVALLFYMLLVPMLTFMTTYYISAGLKHEDGNEDSLSLFEARGYFLSSSIDKPPAANIGTLGLSVSLTIIAVVIFIKHKCVSKQLRGIWTFTHRMSLSFGLLSYIGGMGVAAYQHHLDKTLHLLFAGIFFISAVVHMTFEVILMSVLKLDGPRALRFRQVLVVMCLVLCPTMIGCLFYSRRFTRFSPEHLLFRDLSASAEIMMFVSLLLYFASYYSTFWNLNLVLSIVVRSPYGVRKSRLDWMGRASDERRKLATKPKKE